MLEIVPVLFCSEATVSVWAQSAIRKARCWRQKVSKFCTVGGSTSPGTQSRLNRSTCTNWLTPPTPLVGSKRAFSKAPDGDVAGVRDRKSVVSGKSVELGV